MISETAWACFARSDNKLAGKRTYILRLGGFPVLFKTRAEARQHAKERYGYIRHRADLRREPHGWKAPLVVRVTITITGGPQ